MIPNQMQATLWFTRKRTLGVKYDPQFDLFHPEDDRWKTLVKVEDIRPYEFKPKSAWQEIAAQCS